VVDADDSQLMAAVEFAQKAQQSGDVGGAVFFFPPSGIH